MVNVQGIGCLLFARDDCYNRSEAGKEEITPKSLYLSFSVL